MPELRTYQQRAVRAIYEHLKTREDNPCVVIPTAGGKSWVIAQICSDAVDKWSGRVVVLAHVRELLEQNADKIRKLAPGLSVGLYSAGLKLKQTTPPVIVAGIQSAYRNPNEFNPPDLLVIDEAHLIPPDGEGMYRTFIGAMKERNPNLRVIGLTATPFRLGTGPICAEQNILNKVCYEVGVRDLILQGYLSKLVTRAGVDKPCMDRVHIRAGEFVAEEVESLFTERNMVETACAEIINKTKDRRAALIFVSGVAHAAHVSSTLNSMGAYSQIILGETPSAERDAIIGSFRAGELKYLVNVGVLTHGFDVPHIDCIALLRATMSPGLYYQMAGRGFRIAEGKENCLVLDYGGNVLRHGPVDSVIAYGKATTGEAEAPWKECPECHAIISRAYAICPECGHAFPEREKRKPKHGGSASEEDIVSGQLNEDDVAHVHYYLHYKRGASDDAPRTMRVEYEVGFYRRIKEWVCFEHTGFPLEKARKWWVERSNAPFPENSEEAVRLAEAGALAPTLKITSKKNEDGFDRVIGYELGAVPPWREPGWDEDEEDEEGIPSVDDLKTMFEDTDIPF